VSLAAGILKRTSRRAVVVAKDLGVLKELSLGDHAFKFIAASEVVLAPMLL